MHIKVRMNEETKQNILRYKNKKFGEARITAGYIIGTALNDPAAVTASADNFSEFSKREAASSEKQSTTLTLSQDSYAKLVKMQSKCKAPNPARTIEFLMSLVTSENGAKVDAQALMSSFITNDTYLNSQNNLYEKLMKHYLDDSNPDYENREENKALLEQLGLDGNARDIINPFWNLYLSYLAVCELDSERSLFRFADGNKKVECDKASAVSVPEYINIKKTIHSKEVLTLLSGGAANRTKDKTALYKNASESQLLIRLIKSVYCLANVTDIPDALFNEVKGLAAYDFLPLMIDLIERHIAEEKPLRCNGKTVDLPRLRSWKDFFLKNRESRKLTEFYYVTTHGGIKTLAGIPLFASQSLSHLLPTSMDELEECVSNVEALTLHRAKLLS